MQRGLIFFFYWLGFMVMSQFVCAQQNRFLHQGWQVNETGKLNFFRATVPGTIHTDLMNAGIIPDPFYGANETKVQWVGERSWTYTLHFSLSKSELNQKEIHLVFEGLDTDASIFLNGRLMRNTDNMFRTWRIPIQGFVKAKNELRLVFKPAGFYADSVAKMALPLIRPCENNRHYIRKAQYHFGWDWAPKLLTCGIWKPVKLVFTEAKDETPIAWNTVKLVQEKDSLGQSFYFTVAGKPTYMKGANWVPADVFLPRVTKARYRTILLQAKQMGINMLRVWGGGIYESDDFYTLCDSLGIWVWQDFMFAGAMYPFSNPAFKQSVLAEIKDNVLRLRKHRCIVLWCGNNEINEAWFNWGWQKQFNLSKADAQFLWDEYRQFFHREIPNLLRELDPNRDYIPSSPLYGWGRQQSMSDGDAHYWGVWWGKFPKSILNEKVPRFMSEFGMQAMPDFETVKQFGIGPTFSLNDSGLRVHQKHPTGFETIQHYLQEEGMDINLNNWESYIVATQRMQEKVLMEGIRAQYSSNGRCMGSLIWQLNDCWPVCSWSLIDYYGRPKLVVDSLKNYWAPNSSIPNIQK